MYKQYGKPSGPLLKQKTSFFEDNDKHVAKQRKIADVYQQQPLRTVCKNCNNGIKDEIDFLKDGIGYKLCDICGHLNGIYEDSAEYCDFVYSGDDGGEEYARNYEVESKSKFAYRLSSIYSPKAEFLYSSLLNCNSDPNSLSYLDFGCGSGYFVGAMKKMGINNITGTEVSSYQVDFGNSMLNENVLRVHGLDDTDDVLKNTESNVVSLVGVLEHVANPRAVMKQLSENKNVEYVFLSVPVYSISVFIELLNDNMFHRHLHGGHTHLYTKKSLHHIANEFKFDVAAEWWFGADMVDFYRSIYTNLKSKNVSDSFVDNFQSMIIPLIDKMQVEIDKSEVASEVHMLFKKKS